MPELKFFTSFPVYGTCPGCKVLIESVIIKFAEIKSANWDFRTQTLTVGYDYKNISIEEMHTVISSAGFSTDLRKRDDKAYQQLPKSCKQCPEHLEVR